MLMRAPADGPVAFLVSGLASHVLGSLGLARRLAAIGQAVEYWGEELSGRLVRKQGFPFHPLPGVRYCHDRVLFDGWAGIARSPASGWRVLGSLWQRRSTLLPDLLALQLALNELIVRRAPALAILDPLLVSYYPLLHARGVRCVLLQDKPLPLPDTLVPPPTSGLLPGSSRFARARIALSWKFERVCGGLRRLRSNVSQAVGLYTPDQLVAAAERLAWGRQRRSGQRRVGYDLHFEALEEWVLGAPELEFPRERALPVNVRYIGPCVDLQRLEVGSTIERAAAAAHFVYVSMGTSMPHWSADLSLLRRIIRALGGLPGLQVVMAAGTLQACRMLGNSFTNVQIAPLLPQLRLLRVADLAITHAGANAVRECIATATPMLAFPREYDQHGNAARVVYNGIGLRGNRQHDSVASIRSQALRILCDERFSRKARECQAAAGRSEEVLFAQAARTVNPSRGAHG